VCVCVCVCVYSQKNAPLPPVCDIPGFKISKGWLYWLGRETQALLGVTSRRHYKDCV